MMLIGLLYSSRLYSSDPQDIIFGKKCYFQIKKMIDVNNENDLKMREINNKINAPSAYNFQWSNVTLVLRRKCPQLRLVL